MTHDETENMDRILTSKKITFKHNGTLSYFKN